MTNLLNRYRRRRPAACGAPASLALVRASVWAALALAAPLHAAEFCVSCLGPEAHYICAFDGVEGNSQDPRLKLLCITELAGKGGHASCSVDRTKQVPCQGERMVLATPEGLGSSAPVTPAVTEAPAMPSGQGVESAVPAGDAPAAAPPSDQVAGPTERATPAETAQPSEAPAANPVEEIAQSASEGAEKAAKSAGSALEKAGDAVGHAAKKTWDCLSTFFGSC